MMYGYNSDTCLTISWRKNEETKIYIYKNKENAL